MVKRSGIGILIVLAMFVFATGCDLIKKKDSDPADSFKRGPSGLLMEFVPNYPGDKYLVSEDTEAISIVIDIRNKGTYPPSAEPENGQFPRGKIYVSGFDDRIIDMSGIKKEDITKFKTENKIDVRDLSVESILDIRDGKGFFSDIGVDPDTLTDVMIANRKTDGLEIVFTDDTEAKNIDAYIKVKKLEGKIKSLPEKFLPAASPINPLGSIDTAQFDGQIIAENILIDRYDPTILVTACYPYVTKASPSVCIDPSPFDNTQEKVCNIGSQKLTTQGAPIAVTKIDQEAATNKIQFKISIKNVGDGDVLNRDEIVDGNKIIGDNILNKCSPLGGGKLDRKDFDRVKVTSIKVGDVELWNKESSLNKCSPFADGSQDIIRLFDGEGFVICTLNINNKQSEGSFENVESAYTTPISININYNYRSTISKSISITKLTAIS